jgi:hypothetical protein
MVVVVCSAPEVAVTVTIVVVGVGDVGVVGEDGELPPLLPPPQPKRSPSPAYATASSSQCCQPRRFLHPKRPTVKASVASGKNGRDPVGKAEVCELAEMVSWVVAGALEGVTVAGLKAHVAPVGNPEQAKLTADSKLFSGVTVSVVVPWLPESAVSDAGEAPSVKEGAAAMV